MGACTHTSRTHISKTTIMAKERKAAFQRKATPLIRDALAVMTQCSDPLIRYWREHGDATWENKVVLCATLARARSDRMTMIINAEFALRAGGDKFASYHRDAARDCLCKRLKACDRVLRMLSRYLHGKGGDHDDGQPTASYDGRTTTVHNRSGAIGYTYLMHGKEQALHCVNRYLRKCAHRERVAAPAQAATATETAKDDDGDVGMDTASISSATSTASGDSAVSALSAMTVDSMLDGDEEHDDPSQYMFKRPFTGRLTSSKIMEDVLQVASCAAYAATHETTALQHDAILRMKASLESL